MRTGDFGSYRAALGIFVLGVSAALNCGHADEVLIDGLAWRQLTDTAGAGLSWSDVASVCPLNETPCSGSVNGVDFTGWTWASFERVAQLVDTLTGLSVPYEDPSFESSAELLFDRLAPVLERPGVKLSNGLFAREPGSPDATVEVLQMQDAHSSSGNDRFLLVTILDTDTEANAGFFQMQPLGVFLVRDPELELCGNGIDDDGDGDADATDDDCEAANPVISGVEWRQLSATKGVDYWSVVDICPAGGTPCDGTAGGVDFTGWTWAHSLQVRDMLYELTGVLINFNVFVVPWDSPVVPRFFSQFDPTLINPNHISAHGFTYNSTGEKAGAIQYPLADDADDPATCLNGLDDDADGQIDFADSTCGWREYITVSDSFTSATSDVIGTTGGALTNTLPVFGFYLYREPELATAEACDNTLDDDGDGLIDRYDDDCGPDGIGLTARCTHDPVYLPQAGGIVTIRAEAVDGSGATVVADNLEIWLGFDQNAPQAQVAGASSVSVEYPPGDDFSYRCTASLGFESHVGDWRTVAVGPPDPDFPAIPILLSGPLNEKVDIVFFPDEDEYTSFDDPEFVADVGLLLQQGYFTVPWFTRFQDRFNFWIGKDFANSGPDPDDTDASDGILCLRELPDNYSSRYTFADSAGIVHRSNCRDNAGNPSAFTIEMDLNRLNVAAHETGHRPLGLADEYCCDGGYFTRRVGGAPYANLFEDESACQIKAAERGNDPALCRSIVDVDDGEDWWIFEPPYRSSDPDVRDLMQQSGCDSLNANPNCNRIAPTYSGPDADPNGLLACQRPLELYVGNPDGLLDNDDDTYWACRISGTAGGAVWEAVGPRFDRNEIGISERNRASWFLSECLAGRC